MSTLTLGLVFCTEIIIIIIVFFSVKYLGEHWRDWDGVLAGMPRFFGANRVDLNLRLHLDHFWLELLVFYLQMLYLLGKLKHQCVKFNIIFILNASFFGGWRLERVLCTKRKPFLLSSLDVRLKELHVGLHRRLSRLLIISIARLTIIYMIRHSDGCTRELYLLCFFYIFINFIFGFQLKV